MAARKTRCFDGGSEGFADHMPAKSSCEALRGYGGVRCAWLEGEEFGVMSMRRGPHRRTAHIEKEQRLKFFAFRFSLARLISDWLSWVRDAASTFVSGPRPASSFLGVSLAKFPGKMLLATGW